MKTVFFESLRYKFITTTKMIFISALVLIFILRLRFPKGKSVAAIFNKFVLFMFQVVGSDGEAQAWCAGGFSAHCPHDHPHARQEPRY